MDLLRADFQRYQRLHSWYKHNPLAGRDFYMYQAIGEIPRNGLDPCVTDTVGIHWHFIPVDCTCDTDLADVVGPVYTVNFGPFLRGTEGPPPRCMYDFWIIRKCAGDTLLPWITARYPEWAHIDWMSDRIERDQEDILYELFKREETRYWDAIVKALG